MYRISPLHRKRKELYYRTPDRLTDRVVPTILYKKDTYLFTHGTTGPPIRDYGCYGSTDSDPKD